MALRGSEDGEHSETTRRSLSITMIRRTFGCARDGRDDGADAGTGAPAATRRQELKPAHPVAPRHRAVRTRRPRGGAAHSISDEFSVRPPYRTLGSEPMICWLDVEPFDG